MMWIKKGINDARDQYIYPHPNQTTTTNNFGTVGAYVGIAF